MPGSPTVDRQQAGAHPDVEVLLRLRGVITISVPELRPNSCPDPAHAGDDAAAEFSSEIVSLGQPRAGRTRSASILENPHVIPLATPGLSRTVSRGWLGSTGIGSGRTNRAIRVRGCTRRVGVQRRRRRRRSARARRGRCRHVPAVRRGRRRQGRRAPHRRLRDRAQPRDLRRRGHPDDVYPGFGALAQFAADRVPRRVRALRRGSAFDSALFDSWFVRRSTAGTHADDREIICVLGRHDAALMTGSMRESNI